MSMKKIIIFGVVILVIVLGWLYFKKVEQMPATIPETTYEVTKTPDPVKEFYDPSQK